MLDAARSEPAPGFDGRSPAPRQGDGDGASPRSIEAMPGEATALDLVLPELRHRFRNIVAVTQSLVNQTLRDDAPIAQVRDTLNQRLAAMATAVDLLLRNEWQPGSLRNTVRDALALQEGYRHRIRCDGPDMSVGSDAVLALTLALHELGTNAIKYGALSSPDGTVELFWKIIDGSPGARLWMQWVERDGPPVRPPASRGFGSRLVSTATGRALGGHAELAYDPQGVTWLLIAPLDRFAA